MPEKKHVVIVGDGFGGLQAVKKLAKKKFRVYWGTAGYIEFRAIGIYMGVEVDGSSIDFGDAVGMMGTYGTGDMLDRQGNVMDNADAYGMEWQVRGNEPVLFREKRAPQWPEHCNMPSLPPPLSERRNLREDSKLGKQAEKACAGVVDFEMCVQDVMLTGDIELAEFF